MSRPRLGDLNLRYTHYRYVNRLEKEANVRLGFALFGAGAVAALAGLALFVYAMTRPAQSAAYFGAAQPAYALAMVALPLALLGIVILLPPDSRLLGLAALGLLVCLGATVGFVAVYPGDWFGRGADHTLRVLLPYAAGVGALGIGVAASMREHAPELIETVTTIHEPGASAASSAGDESDGDASGDAGPDVPDETAVVDSGPDAPAEAAVAGSGADVPDETAVVGAGGDATDEAAADDGAGAPAETAVIEEGADETAILGDASADGDDEPITLVVNGSRYSFGDGDVFGRRDEPWLDDLIAAADGHEEIPYVSGDHLRFSVEDGGVYVTDQSRNGTKLNGRDVSGETVEVQDGDTLILSDRAKVHVELD